jgi:transposase InsO family protein
MKPRSVIRLNTAARFRQLLAAHGSGRVCPAVVEAFYSTLKTELLRRHAWPTMAEPRRAIFQFVELFYNRQRLHSTLGYLTPAGYESVWQW